jgi:hypothetical protein
MRTLRCASRGAEGLTESQNFRSAVLASAIVFRFCSPIINARQRCAIFGDQNMLTVNVQNL